jgi:endonuclease-8
MPEGDTIFRAARTLDRALAGKTVVRFESVLPVLNRVHEDHPLTGRTIEHVRALGKHILMQFSGDLILHTHMRMNGSWHIYKTGEAWQRPRRDMRLVVTTADYEAVGFTIPIAEFLNESELRRHPVLGMSSSTAPVVPGSSRADAVAPGLSRTLGPDLLDSNFDRDEALQRLRARGAEPIADALLNQRVMAGIGNVYKSEVLFVSRINPFMPVDAINDGALARIIDTALKLLAANVVDGVAPMTTYTGFRRTTGRDDPSERLWVYGRARQRCRRCGTAILSSKHGQDARLTYWCPTCQPS